MCGSLRLVFSSVSLNLVLSNSARLTSQKLQEFSVSVSKVLFSETDARHHAQLFTWEPKLSGKLSLSCLHCPRLPVFMSVPHWHYFKTAEFFRGGV